jgi:hypothetical protein
VLKEFSAKTDIVREWVNLKKRRIWGNNLKLSIKRKNIVTDSWLLLNINLSLYPIFYLPRKSIILKIESLGSIGTIYHCLVFIGLCVSFESSIFPKAFLSLLVLYIKETKLNLCKLFFISFRLLIFYIFSLIEFE